MRLPQQALLTVLIACLSGFASSVHAQGGHEGFPTRGEEQLRSFHPGAGTIHVDDLESTDTYEHVEQGVPLPSPADSTPWQSTASASRAFPYGAPLVGYEHARTCYPHHYCKNRHCDRRARKQCEYWGYPEYFCEPPFGGRTRSYFRNQVYNGLARQLALYNYDFYPLDTGRGGELKPRGIGEVAKVARLSKMLEGEFSVVTIQPTGDASIDQARRTEVYARLAQMGAPLAIDQVVVATPAAMGRSGVEAGQVFVNQLNNVKSGTAGLAGNGISGPVLPGQLNGGSPNSGGDGSNGGR